MAVPHGVSTRLLVDRYDLSGDMNEAGIVIDHPVADTTGFGMVAKTETSGQHSWKCDIKGWYNSQGSVSAAGSTQPDGTAGSDLALYYLSNLGTAPSAMNKVIGYFPNGLGTGQLAWTGIGGCTGITRTANVNNAVGITASFQGSGPVTRVTCVQYGLVTAMGSTGAIDIGTPSAEQVNGAYCYFWLLGTVSNGAGSVYGTVQASDAVAAGYYDMAKFSGTVASASAQQGTSGVVSGSVGRYINVAYSVAGVGAGTLVVAVGRM